MTSERISALEGIDESVRPEYEREVEKDREAPRGFDRQSPEASTSPPPEREIESSRSRDSAPEPEPPDRGKRVELDIGL